MTTTLPQYASTTFHCVGLSYKKADEAIRGLFSLGKDQQVALLDDARQVGIQSLFIISTCNRTELYGEAPSAEALVSLLCAHTRGTQQEFMQYAYLHSGNKAIKHLFKVGTGLDSQILGDFEIIGQIKHGYKLSRERNMSSSYLERLTNSVIQVSKRIKNETGLSSGTTSVSYASVRYIQQHFKSLEDKKIILFGTGKIGRNTCENLVKHTSNKQITLINRTRDRAATLAGKFDLQVREYAQIEEEIPQADVLIVATGAQNPTISRNLIYTRKPLLILDLSIPRNVDDNVQELEGVTVVHVDELSRIVSDTMIERREHIPAARRIIDESIEEFKTWERSRKFAPVMSALKTKLGKAAAAEIKNTRSKVDDFNEEQAQVLSDRIIQKIAGHFANHLRNEEEDTDASIEFLSKVFRIPGVEQTS